MAERGLLLVSGPARTVAVALGVALALGGCSIQSLAINSLTNALASGTDVLSSDEDPELVREALPFTLKTIEMLLAKDPENPDLLLMACRGFTTYGYAFVELDAIRVELESYRHAEQLRQRALKLYLRARGYCLRAFDVRFRGQSSQLPTRFGEVLREASETDVDLLYWLAGSWGSAISLGLDRPDLVADLPVVRALLERSLELSPHFDRGALHEAMISIEAVPKTMGGSLNRARAHYEAALEATGGQRASTYLSWARAMVSRSTLR